MTSSTVPTVMQALVATVEAALPDVQVINGQPLNNLEQDFVAVGWNFEQPAINIALTAGDYPSLRGRRERYDVACMVVSWRGNADAAQVVLQRCADLYAAIQDALVAAPNLSGVAAITVNGGGYTPAQTDKGPIGTLHFTVTVDAWRQA